MPLKDSEILTSDPLKEISLITNIDIYSLPLNKVFVLNANKEIVKEFNNASQARLNLGLKHNKIVNYAINKEYQVTIKDILTEENISYYFVRNPNSLILDRKKKLTLVFDTLTNKTEYFDTASAAARKYKINRIRTYSDKNLLFEERYKIVTKTQ